MRIPRENVGARHAAHALAATLICLALHLPASAASFENPDPQVRIGVFGLFHPQQLTIRTHEGRPIELQCADRTLRIEGSQSIRLTLQDRSVECRSANITAFASKTEILDPSTDFVLEVPGKIERHYQGALTILPIGHELQVIVAMKRETAVASIVAAETSSAPPAEALKAQAVVTRSYIAAGPRHKDFDFCDTTHCQYLGAPPSPGEPAALAAEATANTVLTYRSDIIRALYSARCGGHTLTLNDIGLNQAPYPYFQVPCAACIRAPERWTRQLTRQQAASLINAPHSEAARLQLVRQLGWQALPSNNYEISSAPTGATLHGTGSGHGVGLCQHGAHAMATEGHTAADILRHYFPNATLQ